MMKSKRRFKGNFQKNFSGSSGSIKWEHWPEMD